MAGYNINIQKLISFILLISVIVATTNMSYLNMNLTKDIQDRYRKYYILHTDVKSQSNSH